MSSDSVRGFGGRSEPEPGNQEHVDEETKYGGEPEEIYIDEGPPLPPRYGADKIRLHVQDPTTICAQWELSGGGLDTARSMPHNPHPPVPRLELTDLTHGRSILTDMSAEADNWWFKAEPDTEYKIRIGLGVGETNHWIAESNTIRTPRNSISDAVDVQWMMVGEKFRELLKVTGFDEKNFIRQTMAGSMGVVSKQFLREALFSGAIYSGVLLSGQVFGSLNIFGSGQMFDGASGQDKF